MIAKSLTGVDFFDEQYGGTYKGRVMLATGRSGSGKTILGLQFLAKGLRQNERSLLLSARPAEDVALYAAALGIPVDSAIESGDLIILEYSDFVPGRDREDNIQLPPDGFLQLKQIIEDQAVQRVVLDSCLPWVALQDLDHLAEHIFSFVRVFHRLGTTSLFTLPKPASTPAFKLRRLLEEVVPVSISLLFNPEENRYAWLTNKYLGSDIANDEVEYRIESRTGIVEASRSGLVAGASASGAAKATFTTPRDEPARIMPAAPPRPSSGDKPKFSDLILRDTGITAGNLAWSASARSGSSPVQSGWASIASASMGSFKDAH